MRSVTIIGAGPAGLTAARVLAAAGLREVTVLERNPVGGGLPLFCSHLGWGMLDLHRVWTGPRYARELVRRAGDATLLTDVTVTRLGDAGVLDINRRTGPDSIASRFVLLATGIRELPRGPRLVSGMRPWGVTTTGALQEMVQAGMRPFSRPVIVGSELVAFSALLTARHGGIRPVAMIEPRDRVVAYGASGVVARLGARFGSRVPLLTATGLVAIEGRDRVEAVVVERNGARERLACDGVIFSGDFVPEAFLARNGGLAIDAGTGGPAIDNFFRCSDPAYFAAGNLLRPVEHSGVAAFEGAHAARCILRALDGLLPDAAPSVAVSTGGAMRYAYPQRIVPDGRPVRLFGRAQGRQRGWLRVLADGRPLIERRIAAGSEQRIRIRIPAEELPGRSTLSVVLDAVPG